MCEHVDRATADGSSREGVGRVRRRAAEVKRRELREGIARFEAAGPTTEADREVLRELADGLVAGLLATPLETLDGTDDSETVEAARDLFAPDDSGE